MSLTQLSKVKGKDFGTNPGLGWTVELSQSFLTPNWILSSKLMSANITFKLLGKETISSQLTNPPGNNLLLYLMLKIH